MKLKRAKTSSRTSKKLHRIKTLSLPILSTTRNCHWSILPHLVLFPKIIRNRQRAACKLRHRQRHWHRCSFILNQAKSSLGLMRRHKTPKMLSCQLLQLLWVRIISSRESRFRRSTMAATHWSHQVMGAWTDSSPLVRFKFSSQQVTNLRVTWHLISGSFWLASNEDSRHNWCSTQ